MIRQEMKTLKVVGLMSGTSVDGIDASLIEINPDLSFKVIKSNFLEYSDNIKKLIFNLFNENVAVKDICCANFLLAEYFADAVLQLTKLADLKPKDIDLIGSHGQTIYHYPTNSIYDGFPLKSTLQIGDPAIISHRTGITCVSNFRTKDIAAGGQGAPLVCFADELIFKSENISRAIQNIGGMANVTVVSPNCQTFAFDTGPGNALIDYYVKKFFDKPYDNDGLIAQQGLVDENWLSILLQDEYYLIEPPKTTGRELFSEKYAESALLLAPEKPQDIVATVTALTAKSIFNAYENFIFPVTSINEMVIGGGGAYNPVILDLLRKFFGKRLEIKSHDDFGISNMYKEAIAFALLAYTSYYNIPNNVPSCTGAKQRVSLGSITTP